METQLPTWIFIILLQTTIFLICINLFTFLYSRFRINFLNQRNKKLLHSIKTLSTKIPKAPEQKPEPHPTPKPTTSDEEVIEIVNNDFATYIDQLLKQTKAYLKTLGSNSTIIDKESSKEQICAILRYHFLNTEQEILSIEDDAKTTWETIQNSNLSVISQLQESTLISPATDEDNTEPETPDEEESTAAESINQAIEANQAAISELEITKRDLEGHKKQLSTYHDNLESLKVKWQEIKPRIRKYYYQLLSSRKQSISDSVFYQNLDQLHNISSELGSIIIGEPQPKVTAKDHITETQNEFQAKSHYESQTTIKKNEMFAEDMGKLKVVITKQQTIIKQLKNKIQDLTDKGDPDAIINEYKQQSFQLEALLSESEQCITQLESEINNANKRIVELENELGRSLTLLGDIKIHDSIEQKELFEKIEQLSKELQNTKNSVSVLKGNPPQEDEDTARNNNDATTLTERSEEISEPSNSTITDKIPESDTDQDKASFNNFAADNSSGNETEISHNPISENDISDLLNEISELESEIGVEDDKQDTKPLEDAFNQLLDEDQKDNKESSN